MLSACPKCGQHLFELQVIEPHKTNFKLQAVQCSSCGTVVGVLDYMNIGYMLDAQSKAIKKIAAALKISVDL